MSWEVSATFGDSEGFGTGLRLFKSLSGIELYTMEISGATKLYKYISTSETITEMDIAEHTQYGQTYRPTDDVCYHNGYLYGTKLLDITDYNPPDPPNPKATRKILQCFRIDTTSGAITKVLDTWDGTGCNMIWSYLGADTTGYADWATRFLGSNIFNARIASWGGALHIGIAMCYEPDEYYVGDNYTNTLNHAVMVLMSIDNSLSWDRALELENGSVNIDGCEAMVGHESQLACFFTRVPGQDDWVAFYSPAWYIYQAHDGIASFPYAGFDHKWWRTYLDDLYYADDDFTDWTFYADYDAAPRAPYFPYATTWEREPLIVDRPAANPMKAYYGTTFDGNLPHGFTRYEGCVTFHGDYVVAQGEIASVQTVAVYKRVPRTFYRAVPVGLAIDPSDERLYATATLAGIESPFMVDIDTETFASGIHYYSGGAGFFKPHAPFYNFVYLYGSMGPDVKCVIYSGAGFCNTVFGGLPSATYIGALRADPFSFTDDVHACIVYSGGGAHFAVNSDDAGDTWEWKSTTPFPGVSMLRTGYLLSGYAAYIGASGIYNHPVRYSEDLILWEDRGAGIPDVTVTDIDAYQ